ncbi:hypothetical protein M413DRAFT_440710 [Hebeloma cylindrosporum]|uniref:Peptidase C14 caspase domain-containing protein n=1 Tax=Hebeloma cylindrosporum TaxID=76867 RepID=A0A0C3CT12_HEBCY|nr:hypothetical protein M413DRAFT_440710 [Hebeloma cylindrosporum h7]
MMWDFGGRDAMYRSRSRSPHPPQLRVPSPVFPIPIARSHTPSHGYGYPTPISSSYPPLNTGYDPYLYSYHEYPSISRAPPSPHPQYPAHIQPPSPMHSQSQYPPNQVPTQVIHVIHHSQHHSKHKKHRKRSHSQSPSNSTPSPNVTFPFPSPITPSTSYHSAPSPSAQQQQPHVHFSSKPPSIVPQTTTSVRPRVNSVPEREREREQPRQAVLRKPPPDARGRTQSHSQSQSQLQTGKKPVDPLNPNFQYSRCTGRKRALCIGINYRGQPNELRGCVNDAKHVREFLISHGRYKSSDILLLTDDSKDPRSLPTRDNLIQAMKWLVRGAKKDDSLFFHYSGHGGQTRDLDGDEVDGWDEVIYPLDFKSKGPIIDDEMHAIMVKTLPSGCRLTAVFDVCPTPRNGALFH